MGLETGTYIDDLVVTNPLGTDPKSAGDDHIRLIKATIKATFPNITGAMTKTQTELNALLASTDIGVTVQGYDVDTAKKDVKQTWTAQQTPMNGTLPDGATINWNGDSNGQVVSVTLAGNRTLAAPTNIVENACYVLRVHQDATGNRTLAWNAAFRFPAGADPVLSTPASSVDIFTFIGGTSVMYCIGQAKALA